MSSTEIRAVRSVPPTRPIVRAFAIDRPTGGKRSEADGFILSGWALGETEPITRIVVVVAGRTLTELSVSGRRPDVAKAYPDRTWAGTSGFQGWVSTVGLNPEFELEVHAFSNSSQPAVLGTISGYRWRPAATTPGSTVPHFLIIGAQQGGARVLYNALIQHDRIQPARMDEIHYFSSFFDRGLRWYQSQFPPLAPGQITGEASPDYLFHPLAAQRLHAMVPEAKLIALLRNPVDRAYSHYQLEVRRGVEPLSFEDAVAAEEERLAGEEERIREDDTYVSFPHQHYSYLARGNYAEQLKRWMALFPRDQILLLRSETYYRERESVLQRVTDFLGLERQPLHLVTGAGDAPYPPLAAATRTQLNDYFAASNAALAVLAGPTFTWDDQ